MVAERIKCFNTKFHAYSKGPVKVLKHDGKLRIPLQCDKSCTALIILELLATVYLPLIVCALRV